MSNLHAFLLCAGAHHLDSTQLVEVEIALVLDCHCHFLLLKMKSLDLKKKFFVFFIKFLSSKRSLLKAFIKEKDTFLKIYIYFPTSANSALSSLTSAVSPLLSPVAAFAGAGAAAPFLAGGKGVAENIYFSVKIEKFQLFLTAAAAG